MDEKTSAPYPILFVSRRQRQIYESLAQLVGPGPASFFADVCWLMENPGQLRGTVHLVAHLLREIESALRAVFQPIAEEGSTQAPGSQGQMYQIRNILQSIGIAEDAPEARAWFELSKRLHGLAHRRGLEAPRPIEEIEEVWHKSLLLLDVLLAALRDNFLAWISFLDKLLTKPQATIEDVKTLLQQVPNNPVTRSYFFDRLENPEWLELLWKRGFFKHPPQPVPNEKEGTPLFRPWPDSRYLARMAPHKPQLVAEIILAMEDTDNTFVHADLVRAALAMPPEVSVKLTKKVLRWAESPHLWVPEKFGELMEHWAKGGKTDEALRLAGVLLDLLPGEKRSNPRRDLGLQPELRSRLDTLSYEQIVRDHLPAIVQAAGIRAFKLLLDLLEKAIRFSVGENEGGTKEDASAGWRPAIEDHAQNFGNDPKDALVAGVRDAGETLVRSGVATVSEIVQMLEQRGWPVFRRIALHILREVSDQANDLAVERLTDRSLFDDTSVRHEYALLLRASFARLSEDDRSVILGWIERGPDISKRYLGSEHNAGGRPSDEEVQRYREIWQRDRLAWIGPENLSLPWQQRYAALVAKYGEPEHPEFPVYSKGVWRGPTSPKTGNELMAMSVVQIVDFLKIWMPPENAFLDPTPEGLGRTLKKAVAEHPQRFATEAEQFRGLDPTYVRAAISGLLEGLKQKKTFQWVPVLRLCRWVVEQQREIPGRKVEPLEADPDWGWTRKTIANLLEAGFRADNGEIPIELREEVWGILRRLTDDPDPTPEYEARSHLDPMSLSVSTTRGRALHAVVQYGLWVQRQLQKEECEHRPGITGFDEMPEVREVLEAHLDTARDPSLAIRAVYGRRYPWLVLLDRQWAEAQKDRIFPVGEEDRQYFETAWDTYVVFCPAYDNVFDVLRDIYARAVQRIGTQRDTVVARDPDKALAERVHKHFCFYAALRVLVVGVSGGGMGRG